MRENFDQLTRRLSPTLRRIAYKLNGHFSFFDEDDLFQEELMHLWVMHEKTVLDDKTDSYILQGCFFHLKNYIRKTLDKAHLTSLEQIIDDEGSKTLYDFITYEDPHVKDKIDLSLLRDAIKKEGLTKREEEVLGFSSDGLTIREIGQRLGISHVMVVKIKKKVKNKLSLLKNDRRTGYQN